MQVKDLQLKRALRTALLVLLLSEVGMGKMYAYIYENITIGDLVYTLDNTLLTAEVTGHKDGQNASGSLAIPSSVTWTHYGTQTYTVTKISGRYWGYGNTDWRGAFQDCSGFTGSLTIPNTVTVIDRFAFYGCSGFTGSLIIPNSVTHIGRYAFAGCSCLTNNLTIGNSVTSIGSSAFGGCSGLTGTLTIGQSLHSLTGIYCKQFSQIIVVSGNTQFDSRDNCNAVIETFTNKLLVGCNNTTIPNSVTTIGDNALSGCTELTSITIPNSVTLIGKAAFSDCSGCMEVHYNATNCGHNYYLDTISLPFRNCSGTLTIGNNVETIPERMFSKAAFTGTLTIGHSVVTIPGDAFSGCSGFTGVFFNAINCADAAWNSPPFEGFGGTLTIGNNVERIPNYIFKDAAFTGNLTIPNSVTTIGYCAFNNCSGFTGSLTIPNSVISIGGSAFYNCSGFTGNLTIGNSVTSIGESAFENCDNFTGSLTIPNSVTTIGYQAFYNCSGFTGNLTIGNSVTIISSNAFTNCSGFTGDLTIPNSVTSIGKSAFFDCNGFTEVHYNAINCEDNSSYYSYPPFRNFIGTLTIGTNVERIPKNLFLSSSFTNVCYNATNCADLTDSPFSFGFGETLIIGNNVERIPGYLFSGCSGFTGSLILPNSVTEIGNYAFNSCSGFTGNLTIPNSVIEIGDYAFRNCSGFTGSLNIPNSVTTIGKYAFYNCNGFNGNLIIGNSLTTIGYAAFGLCSGFTGSLTIGNFVTSIGDYAFYNCSGFTNLTIPETVTSIGGSAYKNCSNLATITMFGITPPTLGTSVFSTTSPNFTIYVPYESLNAYKTANNWRNYAPYIKAMFAPCVAGYGSNTSNDKWKFIALPLAEDIAPTEVLNMLSEDNEYDLYQFDQSAEGEEWRNYKVDSFNLVNGRGYLYARAVDVNLVIGGDFNEDDIKEVSLDYDAGKPFAGWNLVGNPFPVSAYANRSYYVMNEDGTAIEPVSVSSETAIAPCIGIMVKAETTGELVTFSKTAPEAAVNQGVLQIAVVRSNTRGNAIEDKAIVSFNAGDHLEKFVFNKDNATLCIPQGGKDLAIAYTEKVGEMPLNFKAAKNGEYTITVNPEAVEMNYLHLIDNMTGNDIDLLASPSYSFNAQTTDYASRFCLVFSICEDANGDNGDFAFISNGDIIINGEGMVQVIDMAGHIIVSVDEYTRCIPTTGMTSGVYVLRLINGNDVKTQKIVVR